MKTTFTTSDVSRLVPVTVRQIHYWDSSSFIEPRYRATGRRTRMFTLVDVVLFDVVHRLREAGHSIQRMRSIVGDLRRMMEHTSTPLEELTIMIWGDEILLFRGAVETNLPTGAYTLTSVAEMLPRIDELFDDDRAAA